MAAASTYLEQAIGNEVLGGTAWAAPATLYLALFTAAPTDDGGGTEVSGGAYSRLAVTNNTTNWPTISGSQDTKSNASNLTFPTATGAWGTVTHWGVFDGSTGGNLLLHGALVTARTVANGDIVRFPAGFFQIRFS